MSKELPYHYTDAGYWCRWSNVRVGDSASCPNGCEGALHHYANDGHDECADDAQEVGQTDA